MGTTSNQDMWSQIVHSSLTPCAVFDTDLRYRTCNAHWRKAFRLPSGDLGNCHDDVALNTDAPWCEAMKRGLSGEDSHVAHDQITHRDGTTDEVRWSVHPWRNVDGDVGGVIVNAQVITAHVSAERRLDEQGALERALFEHSPIGMNLCRMDGTWLESNPAFLNIIGYEKAEADGKLTYWELTPRSYDDKEAVQLEALKRTNRYGPYEKEFIRKDGNRVPVQLNGFIIERDDEQFIWSLIEDISARKGLEVEVEQERLKTIQASKLAMLGEMAAGIAHEINNPLAIIDGYLQVLSTRKQDGPLFDEGLNAMRDAGQRAKLIVDGLRKFARDDAPGPLEHVRIKDVVDQTLVVYAERLKNRGVELKLDTPSDVYAICRPHPLAQVFLNLVTNAFHAVEGTPNPWISLTATSEAETVFVRVSDSGPGVAEENREKIFQPFFTTKAVGHGTGLGLSISKGIVEAFGGDLSVVEDETEPTTFVITLAKAPS